MVSTVNCTENSKKIQKMIFCIQKGGKVWTGEGQRCIQGLATMDAPAQFQGHSLFFMDSVFSMLSVSMLEEH